jgi:hypothetical protein
MVDWILSAFAFLLAIQSIALMVNVIDKPTTAIVITDMLLSIGENRSKIVRSIIAGLRVVAIIILFLTKIESTVIFNIKSIT